MNRIKKTVLTTAVVMTFLLLLVICLPSLPFFNALLVQILNQHIPGQLQLESLHINLLSGELRGTGCTLLDVDNRRVVTIKYGYASLNWPALFDHELRFRKIRLTGVSGQLPFYLETLENEFLFPKGVRGQVTLDLSGTGTLNDPEMQATLIIEQGEIDGVGLFRGQATLRMEDRKIRICSLSLESDAGCLTGNGKVDLSEMFPNGFLQEPFLPAQLRYHAALSLDRVTPARLPISADLPAGEVSGHVQLTGQGWTPNALSLEWETNLKGKRLFTAEMQRPVDASLVSRGQFSGTQARVEAFAFTSGRARIEGSGRYAVSSDSVTAVLDVKVPDLSEVLPVFGLQDTAGQVNGRITVQGEKNVLNAIVDMDGTGITCEGQGIDQLTLRAVCKGDRAVLHTCRMTRGDSRLSVSGTAELPLNSRAGRLDLAVQEGELSLSDLHAEAGGHLVVGGRVTGSWRQPEVRLTVTGRDLSWQGADVGSLDGEMAWAGGVLRIPACVLKPGPEGRVGLSGDLRFADAGASDPQVTLDMAVGDVSVASIGLFRRWLPPSVSVAARINGRLNAKGPLSAPELSGNFSAVHVAVNTLPLPDMDLDIAFHEGQLSVNGDAGFRVSAVYDVLTGDCRLEAGGTDVQLAPYLRLAGIHEVSGQVTGKVRLSGPAGAPQQLAGAVEVDSLQLNQGGWRWLQAKDARFTLEQGTLGISSFNGTILETGNIALKGSLSVHAGYALTLDGMLPLQALPWSTDPITGLGGLVAGSLDIRGPVDFPEVNGFIRVTDVGMTLPGLSEPLTGGTGVLRLSPDIVRLEGLSGRAGDGRFEGAGEIRRTGPDRGSAELRVDLTAIPVRVPDTVDSLVNASVKCEASPDAGRLSGTVTLLEGTWYRDVAFSLVDQILKGAEIVRGGTHVQVDKDGDLWDGYRPPWRAVVTLLKQIQANPAVHGDDIDAPLPDLRLNLEVSNRHPLQVINQMADLSVRSDLTVTGTLGKPVVNGRVETVSGHLVVKDRSFAIKKGVIDFQDPYAIRPEINLVSQTRIRNWNIYLEMAGTPEALRLQLRSEPEAEESDLLSLLVFGKTRQELIEGEGGNALSTQQMLAQFLAGSLGSTLKEKTGLDILEIETGGAEGDETGAEHLRVKVGKKLTRRMSVKVGVETRQGETIQEVETEYRLFEHAIIKGFQNNVGGFGGGVVFRLEFQ
ncbi:MAG: hypothetical protein CSA22_03195 [Deltaproteobacteria bacterium]|nr:MAG: hypothetical protein CSA22_03195 [Deltaproteobacteria bacterium]